MIAVLLDQGAHIPCGKCKLPIVLGDDVIREHLVQLALGGKDVLPNMQFWHKACSHLKTNGTKATSYGSDAHARAKARRIAKREAGDVRPKRKVPCRPKKPKPPRSWSRQ